MPPLTVQRLVLNRGALVLEDRPQNTALTETQESPPGQESHYQLLSLPTNGPRGDWPKGLRGALHA